MTKQVPRVKIILTQGDVDVLKEGRVIAPTVRLNFDEKGEVDLRYCIVEMNWSELDVKLNDI
tara:strand:+ start:25 stop:210 length:186 start_codon:yes stop_codon:yes gene_type:complete